MFGYNIKVAKHCCTIQETKMDITLATATNIYRY